MREYQIAYDIRDPRAKPTTLISQLVPSAEPDLPEWEQYGPDLPQQTYIIKFLDANGRAALPEGLMYQLITWFHLYSLGREDHRLSRHWARGMVLDKGYHGRALIRVDDHQLTVTVKAASPNFLCTLIADEICNYVSDWQGLTATSLVLCGDRCAAPSHRRSGNGAFDIETLHSLKTDAQYDAACGTCHRLAPIDALIGDAATSLMAPHASMGETVADMYVRFDALEARIGQEHLRTRMHLSSQADSNATRLSTEIDAQTQQYLRLLADDAAAGPRLFTVEHIDRSPLAKLGKRRLRIVLWCEHSKLPVHLLGTDPDRGVYTVEVDQEWLIKARPWINLAARVLRFGAGLGPAIVDLNLDDTQEKALEERLRLAEATAKELSDVGAGFAAGGTTSSDLRGALPSTERSRGELKALHNLLEQHDPDFAGLQRVRDLDRFLWVHPRFAPHYD
jgi:hypothetical protein